MSISRRCTRCGRTKDEEQDFYKCLGKVRGECKKCTIRRNVLNQVSKKVWRRISTCEVSARNRRSYMREYYAQNKDKYAEYRKDFKEKHPGYYKLYFRNKKVIEQERGTL